ncbi:butyrophilin subfamily 1 member A1-like isoform X4 [Myotis daubentonii]|uniref:butyrophilin subfamily 1 member A1-like isoform X4 n=1 Tax=Myotis daubentonii TaxID=98922 RepID=UPI002873DCDE|nr:butyrophilin subfamily 1 member A1-like isoform X4 [Myotis daubentonii]
MGVRKKLLQIPFFTFNIPMTNLQVITSGVLLILWIPLSYQVFFKQPKENKEAQNKLEEAQNKLADSDKRKEELQQQLEEAQNKLDKLQKELAWRKAQFKLVWMKAPLYADWRKEEFEAVNVTLDAGTAHPALLCEDGKRVTWREPCQDLPHSTQRFDSLPCVLGQLDLRRGRSFWEVEVGNARSWDLGICRDNVTRKGRVTMSPQNGFWAIRLYERAYWALTSPETPLSLKHEPCKLGVFLDYEAGDVSFYNMTDGSHIFSFPKNTFSGALKPLFRLWSSDSGSLTIRPGGRTPDVTIDIPN